jgi:hypothetical protein
MLEDIYEDNLIGDPNDLDEIIEQQGDQQFGEAEEQEAEDSANDGTCTVTIILAKHDSLKLKTHHVSTAFYVSIK